MVKASQVCRSDDVFVPQWKHYQQLMFLQGCWDQDDGPDDPPLSPPTGPQEEGLTSVSFLPPPSTSSLPSCTPPNITVKCYWTEERERALITFFSEHNCLWNKRSENHNNRQLRLRLLETLKSQLSDDSVSLSVEDIKCKFKNLRTVFNREYKVVQASRTSHKPYVSKWKHYQHLLFLCESCDEDDNPQLPIPREDKGVVHGTQTPSSSLNTFSPQTKFNSPPAEPGDVRINSSASYQICLSASPESLKPVGQTSGPAPASPSTSLLDTKPRVNLSPPKFSTSCSVQPDGRPGAESRCHWHETKVQQLISFYAEHSCLWNHRSENYRNKLLRQTLLETLSSLLSDSEPVSFTVEDIKTKFRNLRTIFQREHKAVSSNKTCGSEDFYFPKWRHYRELMFLCDSCDEDERTEEPDVLHLDGQAPPSSHHCTATKLNTTSHSLEGPPSPTPPDSRRSSPSSASSTASSSHTDSRVSGRKRASRRLPPASGEMLDLMRTLCQSQTASPHAGFLKYVEECLNETPPDKVKRLKKKIIETIHSISEEV
ncbi:uncharacterized protein [Antennarius striatus]